MLCLAWSAFMSRLAAANVPGRGTPPSTNERLGCVTPVILTSESGSMPRVSELFIYAHRPAAFSPAERSS